MYFTKWSPQYFQDLPAIYKLLQYYWLRCILPPCDYFFKRFYLFIFREKEREGERGRETSMCKRYIDQLPLACPQLGTWPATQACALTGNWTSDPCVHRPALKPLSHASWGPCDYFVPANLYFLIPSPFPPSLPSAQPLWQSEQDDC